VDWVNLFHLFQLSARNPFTIMKRKTAITIAALAFSLMPAAHAQQPADTAGMLDQLTISTNRMESRVLEAPRMVTVITAKEMAACQCNSLGELLSMQNGASVIGAVQVPGANQAIFLRGAASHQTTILLDGIRISDPSTPNGAVDLSEFSLADIDRIEIVQGGHSTVYGTGAVGGVINIITKKAPEQGGVNRVFGHAGVFGPGHSTGLSVATQQNLGKFFITSQARTFNSGGLSAAAEPPSGTFFLNEPDAFHKRDFALRTGYNTDKLKIWAGFRHNKQLTDIDAGAYRDDENYTLNMERNTLHSGGEYHLNSRYSLHYTAGISNLVRKSNNDSSLIAPGVYDGSQYNDRFAGVNRSADVYMQGNYNKFRWTGGFSFYNEQASVNSYYYSRLWNYESSTSYDSLKLQHRIVAAFASATLNTGDKTGISGGFRVSHHNMFGVIPSLELNPFYKPDARTLIYANMSSGFSAPSLYQLMAPERSFGGLQRGNPDLQPERSTTVEFGFKRSGNKAGIQTSFFHNRTSNAVQYVYAWNNKHPDSLTFMDNIGDTYINNGLSVQTGIQVEWHVKLPARFTLSGNLTKLNGQQQFESRDGSMLYQIYESGVFLNTTHTIDTLSRRASTANIQLTHDGGKAGKFTLRARHVSRKFDVRYDMMRGPYGALAYEPVNSYILIDFIYQIQVLKGVQLGLSCLNLANSTYVDIVGFNTRPRSFMCNASLRF
jgi:vitamin B12 transporter